MFSLLRSSFESLPCSLAFIDKVDLLTGMLALFNLGQEYYLNILDQNRFTGGHRD
jgi:hypothetical protein